MAISNINLRASTSTVSNLKANVDASITVKSSPLTHEEIDLNFLELADAVQTNAFKNPLIANLNAGAKNITNVGNIAVGTSTPAGVLTVDHANLTNSTILVRTGLTGDDMYSSLRVKSKRQSSTNMGDNFGSSISFQIEDDGATGDLGYLGFKRNGADSTGKFSINTYSAGSASETLTLTAAGVLTVNTVVAGLTGAVTGTVSSLSNHNTGALSEGSNLYFTNARADARADTRIAASSINTLSDVNTSGVATNSILKYNGSAWVVSSDTDSTDISSNTVGQLSDVTITSAAANQVLKWNGSAWINSATPITAGSIGTTELATNIPLTTFTDSGNTFAKSTLATNITGNAKNITGVTTIGSTNATIGTLTVDTQFDVSGPMKSNVAVYGSVPRFQRFITSAVNTDYSALIVEAKSSAASSDNFGPVVDFKLTDSSSTQSLGYVGFVRDGADNSSKFVVKGTNAGSISTQLTIDKSGIVDLNGGPLLLGNKTTTERDALTPANGMMLYNTTDNKFQGYENGAWVNLI